MINALSLEPAEQQNGSFTKSSAISNSVCSNQRRTFSSYSLPSQESTKYPQRSHGRLHRVRNSFVIARKALIFRFELSVNIWEKNTAFSRMSRLVSSHTRLAPATEVLFGTDNWASNRPNNGTGGGTRCVACGSAGGGTVSDASDGSDAIIVVIECFTSVRGDEGRICNICSSVYGTLTD